MSQLETQSIPREQFLSISTNLIYRALIEASRTDAKKIFREISEGGSVPLTRLQMEDRSTVDFHLSMNHSEFRGKLNYGAFRDSVNTLVGNIVKALEEKKDIQTFGADDAETTMIFGVTGVTVEDEQPNVMVLSANMGGVDAAVTLRLVYLDPDQFVESAGTGGSA